jgi:Carboxypeptidase regulatory-like domain
LPDNFLGSITNAQTGTQLTAITDQGGVFTFPVLPVGQYQLDLTSHAFQPYRKTGLVIDINSYLFRTTARIDQEAHMRALLLHSLKRAASAAQVAEER